MKNKLTVAKEKTWWGSGRAVGVAIKGNIRTPCSDGQVLYLDYINGSISVANLTIIFAKCYHREKPNSVSISLLYLTTA